MDIKKGAKWIRRIPRFVMDKKGAKWIRRIPRFGKND